LALADVYSALAYYHEHRAEIDEGIRDSDRLAEAMRKRMPSKIPYKGRA
jgi:ribonuclease HII